jgi:hypothetical protein
MGEGDGARDRGDSLTGVIQRNPDPNDPIALRAASVARDFVRAVMDGDEGFLPILATQAVEFLGTMPTGEGLTDPEWMQLVGEFMLERGKREARLTACLAMVAALALDAACPDDIDRSDFVRAFLLDLLDRGVTF